MVLWYPVEEDHCRPKCSLQLLTLNEFLSLRLSSELSPKTWYGKWYDSGRLIFLLRPVVGLYNWDTGMMRYVKEVLINFTHGKPLGVYIILFRICFKLWPCFHRTMTEKLSNHVGAAFWHTIYQWDRHWYWRVGFPTKKVNFPFFTIIILHIPDQWSNIKASKFGEFLRSTSFFNQVVSAGVAQLRN